MSAIKKLESQIRKIAKLQAMSDKLAIEQIHADAKRFATLKAQFALVGHTLHQSGPGDGSGPVSYMAERWGMARYLPTLADAEQFLKQVGGSHGI